MIEIIQFVRCSHEPDFRSGRVSIVLSVGGYGSAGEQPERRHGAKDRAERSTLCSLLSVLFLAASEKLTGQPDLVCTIGSTFRKGFAIEVFAITSPGMVRGRCPGGLDLVIERFGIGDYGLAWRLVVDGVGQGFVFVEDGDFSLGVLADGDLRHAQGIARRVVWIW